MTRDLSCSPGRASASAVFLGAALLAVAPMLSAEEAGGDYTLENAFPGLKFDQPLGIVTAPGKNDRIYVAEKTGRIQMITALNGSTPKKSLFLDLTKPRDGKLETESECGVLGLAFPPDHATSHCCYVYYSLKIGGKLHQRVSRFTLAEDGTAVTAGSEQPLLSQADPASNHNGGDLQFGPDGYLYISTGDGGAADDRFNTARFIDKEFHGAILRIDVNALPGSLPPNPHPGVPRNGASQAHYTVPADNPFVGAKTHHGQAVDPAKVRTEIWATGLRNPWRISFDVPTGRLFTGDVGQNLYEEINLITKGGDYGWSYREAEHPFRNGPGKANEPEGFKPIEPIFEYPRAVGISVTGGVVYRGTALTDLRETYIFADYGSGIVIALRAEGEKWIPTTLGRDPGIAGIGTDPRNGELLFANLGDGKVKRLSRKGKAAASKP